MATLRASPSGRLVELMLVPLEASKRLEQRVGESTNQWQDDGSAVADLQKRMEEGQAATVFAKRRRYRPFKRRVVLYRGV